MGPGRPVPRGDRIAGATRTPAISERLAPVLPASAGRLGVTLRIAEPAALPAVPRVATVVVIVVVPARPGVAVVIASALSLFAVLLYAWLARTLYGHHDGDLREEAKRVLASV